MQNNIINRILYHQVIRHKSASSLAAAVVGRNSCTSPCIPLFRIPKKNNFHTSRYYNSSSIISNSSNNSNNKSSFIHNSNKTNSFIRTSNDKQVIRDLFLSFATPNDDSDTCEPSLDVHNLRDLLLAIGECPSNDKLQQLIQTVDKDGDGSIDYEEFIAGCDTILGSDNNSSSSSTNEDTLDLIDMFHMLDADGSGDISVDELSNMLSTAGVAISKEDAQEIMDTADSNGDSKIDLEEFLELMSNEKLTSIHMRIKTAFRVCLMMGGPGSGKGTLCDKLIEHAKVQHFSSGEALREEIASGSPLSKSIEQTMKEGKLLPSCTIIALVKKQLRRYPGALVVLDGFPRSRKNFQDFVDILGTPEFVISVDVPDDVMIARILKRAETSGRADDNIDTAQLRIKT